MGVFLAVFSVITFSYSTNALSAGQWQAGRIIDDSVFYSGGELNSASIQAFLDSKVPSCDTWGQKGPYYDKYGQRWANRAEYAYYQGYPSPYTCLKSYKMTYGGKSADNYCSEIPAGDKTAAEIIDIISRSCGVSARALIVMLEKEQGLVTDDWPWSIQYRSAMGYGCPDTAPCDSEYYGFFNQVYNAARQFKVYAANVTSYRYRPYTNNFVYWSPDQNCNGSNIMIDTKSTAGLYNYTPYQPNQAALNNLYGTGDGCSAYGNRNFWRLFNDWFGNTKSGCYYPDTDGTKIFRLLQPDRNSYLLTADPLEVCFATTYYGYIFDDTIGNSVANGSPVYRLRKSGNYVYTMSSSEKESAIRNYGYIDEGEAFKALSAPLSQNYLPVHRLSYPLTGGYLYSPSEAERQMMISQYGFRDEGSSFYLNNELGVTILPVYRMSSSTNGYFFTNSSQERWTAISLYGYRDEGTGFSTRAGYTTDSLPVYRLSSPQGYLYTTDFGERKYARLLGFRPEGVGFHAYPTSNMGATQLIQRLSKNGRYLYTASPTELTSAVNVYGFRYEGQSFRTP